MEMKQLMSSSRVRWTDQEDDVLETCNGQYAIGRVTLSEVLLAFPERTPGALAVRLDQVLGLKGELYFALLAEKQRADGRNAVRVVGTPVEPIGVVKKEESHTDTVFELLASLEKKGRLAQAVMALGALDAI